MAKTVFQDGDKALGIPGTKVLSSFLNSANNHHHTGRDVDGEGALPYAATGGTANVLTIALSPALPEYIAGMPLFFKASADNTGAVTLNVNALGAKAVRKSVDLALERGDIRAGQIVQVVYDGINFQLVSVAGEPVAAVKMFAGAIAPNGYLLCDGAAVSRSTYAALFAVVGTTYGVGDGSTTFNVPNFKGRSPVGVGQGNTAQGGGLGTDRVLGAAAGAETHTLVVNEMPAHTHSHTIGNSAAGSTSVVGANNIGNLNTSSAGGGLAHNNMGPVLAVNFVIKY